MKKDDWTLILNSLASGIEMRLNLHFGLSDIAVEETKILARKLVIPEEDIDNWAADTNNRYYTVKKDIESLLTVLKKNATAQRIFSNFVLYEEQGYDKNKLN